MFHIFLNLEKQASIFRICFVVAYNWTIIYLTGLVSLQLCTTILSTLELQDKFSSFTSTALIKSLSSFPPKEKYSSILSKSVLTFILLSRPLLPNFVFLSLLSSVLIFQWLAGTLHILLPSKGPFFVPTLRIQLIRKVSNAILQSAFANIRHKAAKSGNASLFWACRRWICHSAVPHAQPVLRLKYRPGQQWFRTPVLADKWGLLFI